MKGIFITFEGSEGSGKSTQSRMLCRYMARKGFKVVFLREPGATRVSEKIRKILLDKRNVSLCPEAEMLLYMASRAQTVREVIAPALKAGKIVVCDRFLDSTTAYQGYGLGIDLKLIRLLGGFSTAGVSPGLTIFLDLPVREGLKHRDGSKDRIEKRPINYHERVRAGYLKIAACEPRRVKVIKLQPGKDATQRMIRNVVEGFICSLKK